MLLTKEQARAAAEENVARSGVLLSDETILRAMEDDLAGRYIPVKMKKDGSFGPCAYSPDAMAALEGTLRDTVSRIGGEMCSGDAGARPRIVHGQSPCEDCPMQPVCRTGGKTAFEENPPKEGDA